MRIDNEISLDFDDVMFDPQRSNNNSRSEAEVTRTFKFFHSPRTWTGIPIMCANMSFSSFQMADALRQQLIITCLHKYHTVDELINYFNDGNTAHQVNKTSFVWISIGCRDKDFEKITQVANQIGFSWSPNICIDVPNGHMDSFVEFCAKVRKRFPISIIMAGNVTNPSSTQELIVHGGVDIVKVGIGGGSACTTRFLTGCGVPQFTACCENAHIAHGQQKEPRRIGLICSDGGHKNPGDICKAYGAGADFVMLGGMFAGVDECVGEWSDPYEVIPYLNYPNIRYEYLKNKKTFTYYGMSTHHSQLTYEEEQKHYRASEGTKITVNAKGPVSNVTKEILGGIRSCCLMIGSDSIKNISKCARFRRVNSIHQNKNPVLGV